METEKKPLHSIFTAVPGRYDLINRIFTWGLDAKWRLKAARLCLETQPKMILDLCCGTGDLAIGLAQLANPSTEIVGFDYSPPMLERAREKASHFTLKNSLTFVHGDVTDLPFPDGYFDCIGISFAFRNLTYKNPKTERYLAEIVRVLKEGGQFVIVESSQPPNIIIRKLDHLYLRTFVRWMGSCLSKNKPAYTYLTESASRFYTAEELGDLLIKSGFSKVTVKRLLFGATAIHVAVK
ncbi:MAG: bifunctional demethylmenaquinone methyltransferase/2-methoxy-6-polyprenyl-1,4-benzoquinol methylase UbiE [Dehalococcoidales bacterium]|nr:bifunctional demethylmenaquinone methyltransferase/2-methoxy-6-polyprenyl-1,4-benzoquinol methylase UbiE [Dehalococcoidales bacterium]